VVVDVVIDIDDRTTIRTKKENNKTVFDREEMLGMNRKRRETEKKRKQGEFCSKKTNF
jgi:hypothetical protein